MAQMVLFLDNRSSLTSEFIPDTSGIVGVCMCVCVCVFEEYQAPCECKYCVIFLPSNGSGKERQSHRIVRLDRPLGLQELEAPRISRQSVHGRGNVVSPRHQSLSLLREYSWYSFLIGDESVSGP